MRTLLRPSRLRTDLVGLALTLSLVTLAACTTTPYERTLSAGPPVNADGTLGSMNAPPPTAASVAAAKSDPPGMESVRREATRAPIWMEKEGGVAGARVSLADCYAFIACASSDNTSGRYSLPKYVSKGVPTIVDDEVLPFYNAGWRRFYVDSPFGKDTTPDGQPSFTFFGSIRGSADSPWRRGFVESWKRVTSRPGVKVLAYFGNPYSDPEFNMIASRPDAEVRLRALVMLREATRPIVEAGFQAFAVDASNGLPEDSVLAQHLKELADGGMEIFIEATPLASQPWLARFGSIRTTWFARGAPTFKGLLDLKDIKGEQIQLFDGNAPTEADKGKPFDSWAARWVRSCLARGEKPAFGPHGFTDVKAELNAE